MSLSPQAASTHSSSASLVVCLAFHSFSLLYSLYLLTPPPIFTIQGEYLCEVLKGNDGCLNPSVSASMGQPPLIFPHNVSLSRTKRSVIQSFRLVWAHMQFIEMLHSPQGLRGGPELAASWIENSPISADWPDPATGGQTKLDRAWRSCIRTWSGKDTSRYSCYPAI